MDATEAYYRALEIQADPDATEAEKAAATELAEELAAAEEQEED